MSATLPVHAARKIEKALASASRGNLDPARRWSSILHRVDEFGTLEISEKIHAMWDRIESLLRKERP